MSPQRLKVRVHIFPLLFIEELIYLLVLNFVIFISFQLHDSYQRKHIKLKNTGIEPNGESYTVKAVENAITRAIGVTPKIKCRPDNWQQLQLYEIYFCVNTTNHFFPCNPSLDHQANCGSDTDQNICFHKFDSDFSHTC
ncbi:Ribonuclease T2-like [Parasponia andersonii]|uniref:Ribonuclease T2-like n=1 Tax=Parasponia andersonii TaxID=3476 RepID=A0A2P5A3U1_PARAD|nr:Ribonuclease T2-like [Parasponia andersonii]